MLASFAQPESASKSQVLSGSLLIRFTGGGGSQISCFWKHFSSGFQEGRLEVFFVFFVLVLRSLGWFFLGKFLEITVFFPKI